jgi:hypothetical protein
VSIRESEGHSESGCVAPFALALSVIIININRTHLRRDCPAHLGEGDALCEGKRACDPLYAVVGAFVHVDAFDVFDEHVD